ncbi:MAG: glucoamylase family protein [Gemmatimonadota bacterium]
MTSADRTIAPRNIRSATSIVLVALAGAGCAKEETSAPLPVQAAFVPTARQTALIDTVSQRTFQWFWDTTDPNTGLTPDRWPRKDFSSVAAIGFALTAYPLGAERGWVTRADAASRTLATLKYLYELPQGPAPTGTAGHKGFFYHFLDFNAGRRFDKVELSTIDTALLIAGALFCQSYFATDAAGEPAIRAYADSIYRRVEWPWAVARPPALSHGWHPEKGFIVSDWKGYNEAMIAIVLGLGSPTHPLDSAAWTAWTSTYKWNTYQGQAHLDFAPLFGHQYSHVWIDFRGIRDPYMRERGIDYFENSRRATLSQRAYATANPMGWRGYSADVWGLTASDGPFDGKLTIDGREREFHTYWARGVSSGEQRDDGTIAPTAAVASIAFAPEIAIPATVAMREQYGAIAFGQYGFLDAFNPTLRDTGVKLQHGKVDPQLGWGDTDYLGIDQGPILAMIENWRSEIVWKTMRTNPHIIRGLRRAGFTGGWLDGAPVTP